MISLKIIGKPKQNNEKSMKHQFRLENSNDFQLFQIISNFPLRIPIFQCFKGFGPIWGKGGVRNLKIIGILEFSKENWK